MNSAASIGRVEQFAAAVDLGDARRTRRLAAVVRRLARHPDAPLPSAMGSAARLEGLYRLVNNRAVTFDALVDAQKKVTAQRAADAGELLVVHDTSTLAPKRGDVKAIGYLNTGSPGFFLHASLVVTLKDGQPLGMGDAQTLTRKVYSKRGRRTKASGKETAKWKNRESDRWWRGVQASEAVLPRGASIHVIDREGDAYPLLATMHDEKLRFVVRCYHDRRARDASEQPPAAWTTLHSLAEAMTGVLTREVPLASRQKKTAPRSNHQPRDARLATLQFAASRVTVPAPNYVKSGSATIDLNVVRVWEDEAPEGETPVEWLLYTTEPADTPEEVARVVDIYRRRWLIEEFFKALKTGCAYEKREFESLGALQALLAICLPIACELLWLRNRARQAPDAPAAHVLTRTQLEVLRAATRGKLAKNPTAADALAAVAALGGHLKSNGPPGWQILYRGMKALLLYEVGWTMAKRHGGSPIEM